MEWYWYLIFAVLIIILWMGKEIHDAPLMPDDYDNDDDLRFQ